MEGNRGINSGPARRLPFQPSDEERFRPIGVGASVGCYFHSGKNFYIYPTESFFYNTVYNGRKQGPGT